MCKTTSSLKMRNKIEIVKYDVKLHNCGGNINCGLCSLDQNFGTKIQDPIMLFNHSYFKLQVSLTPVSYSQVLPKQSQYTFA